MKTLISDHDYELHLGGTTKPGIHWIAAVISGTCVGAHDSAATWMMNTFAGLPVLISLMSTVASLTCFLFTPPTFTPEDKIDRRS